MFWSLLLEPGKRYTKVVDSPFHISAAVLDTSTQDHGIVRVIVDIGDTEALIANLSYKLGILQFPLDLQFDSGSRISFYTTGAKSNVHLSGYVTYDEEFFSDDNETSSDEEEVPMLVNSSAKRKPEESGLPGNKKAKLQKINPVTPNKDTTVPAAAKATAIKPGKKATAAVSAKVPQTVSMDEDDEDGLDDSEEGEEEEELEEEEDMDDDDDDDEETDEEESDEETEILMTNKQKIKANDVAAKKDAFPTKKPVAVFSTEKTPKGAKTPGSEGAKTPKAPKTPKDAKSPKTPKDAKTPKTPGGEGGAPDKAKKTPNKPQGHNTAAQNGKTPKSETPGKEKGKSPQMPKMMKPGGVMCEDLVVGKGPEARNGKMVHVYYEGRLASNKKMFDKCDTGKGLRFRLGTGEVIKGWDVGVSGMKVGGKRKITCPPQMAYGKRGAPPDIPGNAALSFVVELKGIS